MPVDYRYINGQFLTVYPERLKELNMLPLSYRRDISDLCQLFRFLKDPDTSPPNSLLFPNHIPSTRQANVANVLSFPRCKSEQSRSFYFNRIVYSWNKLPYSIRCSDTLHSFKNKLIKYFNENLSAVFNVDNICTWVHECKCSSCRLF